MIRVPTILFLLTTQLTFGQSGKVKLFEFKNSTCDQESDPSRLRTRITKKELNKNLLTLDIAAVATCCVDFIPKATFKKGTLNLDIEETGEACECSCVYEFEFRIEGIKDDKIKIKFRDKDIEFSNERYLTYPIKYKILNGDTINYVDKYGFRQGKWNRPDDSLMAKSHGEFIDGRLVKVVKYFPSGKIESEKISEKVKVTSDNTEYFNYFDFNKYVEYYESGTKKKECYNNQNSMRNSYEQGKCNEWNEKGELTYEGDFRK
jgi:hypothetical protein